MSRRTPTEIHEYFDIMRRRLALFLIPAVVVPVLVFGISLKWPRQYRSETTILVEPQKVPTEYVRPTVNSDVAARLQTLSQEILSRTRLEKIIDQFSLYKDKYGKLGRDEIIDLMRKDVTVDVIDDPREQERDRSIGGFKISYIGYNPQLTQAVTRQLASLFIEENLKFREEQAEGTTEFMQGELEKARQTLQDQEEKIKQFKAKYMGSLPEQEQSNLALIAQLQATVQANSDAITRAEQQKQYVEAVLQTVAKLQPDTSHQRTPLELELDTRTAELVAAQQKYTPDHPDVKRLQEEVKALKVKVAADNTANPTPDRNAQMRDPEQLKAQIQGLEIEIADRKKRQTEIENKVQSLQGRMEMLPSVEQQFADLNRDYEVSKTNYHTLLDKTNGAATAAELERRAKGEQFRILDPASYPEKPFKPDLIQINAMGLVGGMMLGAGLVFLAEFRDQSIHSKLDASFYLSVPVLAEVPYITTHSERKQNRRRRIRNFATACACSVLTIGGAVFYAVTHPTTINDIIGRF